MPWVVATVDRLERPGRRRRAVTAAGGQIMARAQVERHGGDWRAGGP
jgi:hypothetical protein